MKAAALGLCLLVAVASAAQAADAPKFRDYPVTHVFNGKAAKPHAYTAFARVEGQQVTYPGLILFDQNLGA